MRKLGLIGGMSWVSTRTYYEHINRLVQSRTDRRSSAPLLIESLDFSQLYALHDEEDWERAAKILIASARRLERAGAGALIIGANSMHHEYDKIAAAVDVPILHIAECVGERIQHAGHRERHQVAEAFVEPGDRGLAAEPTGRLRVGVIGIALALRRREASMEQVMAELV